MTQILSAPAFDERIASRSARVGIVGLGYAGLPLAMAFAEAGFDVVGIDLNAERVARDAAVPVSLAGGDFLQRHVVIHRDADDALSAGQVAAEIDPLVERRCGKDLGHRR